jgi:ribosomal protein S18 acetylase RimI-like enzyme
VRFLLDRLGSDGCPPLEMVEVDGWRLRAAEGVLLRANSALPLSDALPLEEVVAFYRARGLPPRVYVSSVELDAVLAARGWERDTEVAVMTGPTPVGPSTAVLRHRPDDAWVDVYWAVDGRGGARQRDLLVQMLHRIAAPATYASVERGGRVVAVGRAVAQEGHLGVYSMAVLPDWRGRGLGQEVLHALGSWGSGQAARTTHLQVLSDNTAALALYDSAGLRKAYGYHYRSLPEQGLRAW